MEREKRRNSILLAIIGAATLLVAMIGATFAYFSATHTVTQKNITTGELKIQVQSKEITQENIVPTTFDGSTLTKTAIDADKNIVQLPFTVTTTGTSIDAYYNIYLTTTSNGKLEGLVTEDVQDNGVPSDLNWLLVKKDSENAETYTVADAKGSGGTFGGDMLNHKLNTDPIKITASEGKDEYYILLIWIKENNEPQNNLQELTLNATVKVEANQSADNLPEGDVAD